MGSRGPVGKLRVVSSQDNIPRPKPGVPTCPAWLCDKARAEWHRVAGPLYDLGLLTEIDQYTLGMYCQVWARYLNAEEVLRREGLTLIMPSGVIKQRPEYFILKDCLVELRAFIKLFGLSPESRMRMHIPDSPGEESELESLLDS